MLRVEDIERAVDIVCDLSIPDQFGTHEVDDYATVEYIEEQLHSFGVEDYEVMNGISKLVINIKSLPFVIKIPFNGRWTNDYDDSEDANEYEEIFLRFTEASDEYDSDDYCARELENTRLLQDAGFGYLVPDMRYVGIFSETNFYIQEKVIPLSDCGVIKASEDSKKKANEMQTPFRSTWLALVLDKYGKDFFDRFEKFCYLNRPEILSDCHSGNYGISYENNPVVFDISGFRD